MNTIESVVGTLAQTYKLLRPETILHVDQLTTERQTNPKLRSQWFYTADGEIYSLQGKKKTPTLAITRGSRNPLFQDSTIDVYCEQLRRDENYRPSDKETQRALKAKDSVLIDLTQLKLSENEEEWSYLAIDTRQWKRLSPEEKKLAQRVYGPQPEFAANMKMLADAEIAETRIFVLNPEYVRKHAQQSSLGRASWLNGFIGSSNFNADVCGRDYQDCARGVRRK